MQMNDATSVCWVEKGICADTAGAASKASSKNGMICEGTRLSARGEREEAGGCEYSVSLLRNENNLLH